jgi:hypothetical protein
VSDLKIKYSDVVCAPAGGAFVRIHSSKSLAPNLLSQCLGDGRFSYRMRRFGRRLFTRRCVFHSVFGTHVFNVYQTVQRATSPRNPRIPIYRFCLQTAFRASTCIFKSVISGSGSATRPYIWTNLRTTGLGNVMRTF